MMILLLAASLMVSGCHSRGDLPDPACTPGAVMTTDLAVVCGTPTDGRRHVTEAQRRRVMASYGVPWADRHLYELDHLVPLELGGGNDDANLWPEPLDAAHRKDAVENALHRQVCSGGRPLADAQRAIASDWTTAR